VDSQNLLILTVYLIIVTYVFYQAYRSLGNQVVIQLDSADLNRQLEEKELTDIVTIKFKLKDSYKLDELTKLTMTLKNISQEATIGLNWDLSSLADFDNATNRVIRLTPGMTDLPQKQVETIVLPGQVFETDLSSDKSLTSTLFKPAKLRKATIKSDPFRLRLYLTVSNLDGDTQSQPLSCQFIPKKLRWTRALTIALKPKPSSKSA
jgi:hypothetical protein